jgi:hypothetical protein
MWSERGRADDARRVAQQRQSLLQPNVYPSVGYPFDQKSIDTDVTSGPAKTFDTPSDETCPSFIPNCKPNQNSLSECDLSCGSYCQVIATLMSQAAFKLCGVGG